MAKLGAALRVSQYRFVKLLSSPKLYAVVAFVLLWFSSTLDGLYAFMAHHQAAVSLPGLIAVFFTDMHSSVMLSIGCIVLFSDAPFYDNMQQAVLLRVGQRTWLIGQMLYIMLGTLLYLVLTLSLIALYLLPWVQLDNDWGAVLHTLAYGNPGEFLIDLPCPISVFEAFTPYQALALGAGMRFMVLVSCAMIIYIVNTAFKTKLGVVAACFVLFLDLLDFLPAWLMRLSPATLSRLSTLNLGYEGDLPGLGYALCFLACAMLLSMALTIVAGKRYDVADLSK